MFLMEQKQKIFALIVELISIMKRDARNAPAEASVSNQEQYSSE